MISCASEAINQAMTDAPSKKMDCREHLKRRTVAEKQFLLLGARIKFFANYNNQKMALILRKQYRVFVRESNSISFFQLKKIIFPRYQRRLVE